MWIATLIKATMNHGRLDFEIRYVDDTDGEQIDLAYSDASPTKKKIRDLARREVARLDALKNEVIDLPVGQSINIDPDTVTPPDPPTQAELDRRAWFDDYQQLQRMLTVIEAIPALATGQVNAQINNLRNKLEGDWLNSYLDGI